MIKYLITILISCLLLTEANTGWKPEYAQVTPEVQLWYKSRELTPEAYERFKRDTPSGAVSKSCCDHGDKVTTKFKVDKTSNGDQWWYLRKDGTWAEIPADIVHHPSSTPNNENILFEYNNKLVCFFPAQGGI